MVVIRLRRMGSNQKPFYRVVVADSKKVPTGRFIETIGHYNPTTDPIEFEIKKDRLDYWVGQGAQLSNTVKTLVKGAEKAEVTS